MGKTKTTAELKKQFDRIKKGAGNNTTLRDDNARAFMIDTTSTQTTLAKLPPYFAKSGTGSIDRLGVKRRTLKQHQGTETQATGTEIVDENSAKFVLTSLYIDAWIENSNVFYQAQTRGQDVRQALTTLMQAQYGGDLQDLAFNGDEASADAFLKLNNGFIKLATASDKTVKLAGTALPTIAELTTGVVGKFKSGKVNSKFKWFMSIGTAVHYIAELQNRNTALGDSAIVDGKLSMLVGFEVEIVDSMADDVILFAPYENLTPVYGFNVTFQTAADGPEAVAKQATYHFLLTDADYVIRDEEMCGVVTVTP